MSELPQNPQRNNFFLKDFLLGILFVAGFALYLYLINKYLPTGR